MSGNEFLRNGPLFSLCGLNCGLCPMFIRGSCPGCNKDSPCYKSCIIGPCSIEHGNIDYCFECGEYPCDKYDDVDLHDSLISHRNQKRDMEKAKRIGIENYRKEQMEKIKILNVLLKEYDIGHRDVFFCLAVNLLELNDLESILEKSDELTKDMTLEEKSDYMKQALNECGIKNNIELRLRR